MNAELVAKPEQRDGATQRAPLLRIENLSVQFSGSREPAVQDVSLTVHERQTLAVVGESGCGKTVTALSVLRLLNERRVQLRGSIRYQDRELLNCSERQMRSIRGGEVAMIFQEPMTSLNPVYTIGDQVMEAALLHRDVNARQAAELAEQAMADVGIDQPSRRMDQYPHEFSGGMRQRAMIAMALVCQPKLLLADEPTTALDVTTQKRILELLDELQRTHSMAMMLITHDFGVVAACADVVCVMYAGRVLEYAAADVLLTDPQHPYTQGLLRSLPELKAQRDRLTTVRHWIRSCSAYERGIDNNTELIPWWSDALGEDDDGPVALREVRPQHWVLCRSVDEHDGSGSQRPDLDVRRESIQSGGGASCG